MLLSIFLKSKFLSHVLNNNLIMIRKNKNNNKTRNRKDDSRRLAGDTGAVKAEN